MPIHGNVVKAAQFPDFDELAERLISWRKQKVVVDAERHPFFCSTGTKGGACTAVESHWFFQEDGFAGFDQRQRRIKMEGGRE